ncbi:MAG: hypothetical protein FWG18_01275, partial [Alphaproteobacteria bacterium]|nr:hypothetical protein [Alphaproteobacteria bacterium]
MNYELNLSLQELEKRTSPESLVVKKLLTVNAPEFLDLANGDKEALKYLTRAAAILEDINLRLDHPDNIQFREFLQGQTDRRAALTKILFDAQKGINAIDAESNQVFLAKGLPHLPGRGVYPADLTVNEFHEILEKMIAGGNADMVAKILNQRTVVVRDGAV